MEDMDDVRRNIGTVADFSNWEGIKTNGGFKSMKMLSKEKVIDNTEIDNSNSEAEEIKPMEKPQLKKSVDKIPAANEAVINPTSHSLPPKNIIYAATKRTAIIMIAIEPFLLLPLNHPLLIQSATGKINTIKNTPDLTLPIYIAQRMYIRSSVIVVLINGISIFHFKSLPVEGSLYLRKNACATTTLMQAIKGASYENDESCCIITGRSEITKSTLLPSGILRIAYVVSTT